MNNFKEGDLVSSKYFKGIREIFHIDPTGKAIEIEGIYDRYFTEEQLNLVSKKIKLVSKKNRLIL